MTLIKRALWSLSYLLEGTYTHKVILSAWNLFSQLWYYVLIGICITTVVARLLQPEKMSLAIGRRSSLSILVAALLGVLSPSPTYVIIPVVAGLIALSFPVSPLIAFLFSSPLMNPILFTMTAGALGLEMALVRALTALALGISAGLLTQVLLHKRLLSLSSLKPGSLPVHQRDNSLRGWVRDFLRLSKFVGKYFALGVFLAALVEVLIPPGWIMRMVGTHNPYSVLVAAAIGVPLYACGGGTIPIMKVMLALGMDKGAVLAFFISGPATKLSTITTLCTALNSKLLIFYLALTLIGAVVFGYIYAAL